MAATKETDTTLTLNNGVTMPALAFGVFQTPPDETVTAVETARTNRQKELAQAEIASASKRAREELRTQVSALAVAGAEKLIRREIDANAHRALLDELAQQL